MVANRFLRGIGIGTLILAAWSWTGAAQAASISDYLFPSTLWDDESFESQDFDPGADGFLDVGDTLRGIVRIQTAKNLDDASEDVNPGGANPELAAVFEVEVLTAVCVTDADGGACDGTDEAGDLYDYTFGAHAAFETDMETAIGGGFDAPTGLMVLFFADDADEFTSGCAVIGQGGDCEGNIVDGMPVLGFGFGGVDDDEVWLASDAPLDPSLAAGADELANLGTFLAQLSVLFNATGQTFNLISGIAFPQVGTDGLIQVVLSGDLGGTANTNTPYDVFDDADFKFSAIPEPATLAIFGFGLLVLGFAVRRRQRGAA